MLKKLLKLPPINNIDVYGMLESHEYGIRMKKDFPIRWKIYKFLDDINIKIRRGWNKLVDNIYWKIRWRYFDRYDCIEIPTLSKTYHDKPEIMLHGMFALLVDYVETEECFQYIDWDSDSEHREVGKEIKFLYDWWKTQRPIREKQEEKYLNDWSRHCYHLDSLNNGEFKNSECIFPSFAFKEKYPNHPELEINKNLSKLHTKFEENCNKEDDEMLIRLIKIRRSLWT